MIKIGLDMMRKALHARKHPGISGGASLLGLARQGLPYLTSFSGRARPPITPIAFSGSRSASTTGASRRR